MIHQCISAWRYLSFFFYLCIPFNTLGPRQNGRRFTDDIFKCIYLNENVWIPIKISLKFVPKAPINNVLALVQIMAWRRPGRKPLSEPMMVSLPTHICVTRSQWVKVWIVTRVHERIPQEWPLAHINWPFFSAADCYQVSPPTKASCGLFYEGS